MSNSKIFKSLLAISISMALAACGGGGGDSSAPAPATNTDAGASTIVTTVPVATYAGAEDLAAFNLLNAERRRCGFGMLAQNAQLDQAARAHADWSLINNVISHNEDPSFATGFTGVTPSDRVSAAGYITADGTGEGISSGVGTDKLGRGEASIRELLAAPYHMLTLLAPNFKDVGISVRSSLEVGLATRTHTNVNVGTQSGFQLLGASDVATYPCDGTTGTDYQLDGEEPNPVPGRDLVMSPLGQPVMVMVRHGQVLTITSASMVKVSNNAPIALRAAITAANDPNNQFAAYGQFMGYVIPDVPLEPSTAYYVTVNGTNDGIPFTRQFTFTTGTGG